MRDSQYSPLGGDTLDNQKVVGNPPTLKLRRTSPPSKIVKGAREVSQSLSITRLIRYFSLNLLPIHISSLAQS